MDVASRGHYSIFTVTYLFHVAYRNVIQRYQSLPHNKRECSSVRRKRDDLIHSELEGNALPFDLIADLFRGTECQFD